MEVTKDYIHDCNWEVYLETYFKDPKLQPRALQNLHKFWNGIQDTNLKVLEFGGGPNISRLISACPHVKDFIFAEYTEACRDKVQAWIDKDPKAFDWKDTFQFIVRELEGLGPDQVNKRQDELRQKIAAIIPCDIKAKNILQIPDSLDEKFGPPYDVVATSFCLEAVVESEQEYKNTVTKLAKLVKPGGYLVIHGALKQTFYMIGSKRFYTFPLTSLIVEESMKNAGVKELKIDLASSDPTCRLDYFPFTDISDESFVFGKIC